MIPSEDFSMRQHWEEKAENYTQTRSFSAVDERVAEIISAQKCARVLEIGSGSGIVAKEILERNCELKYIAFDLAQNFLQIAKMNIGYLADYIQGDVLTLPFKDSGIDIAFEMDSIHHFPRGIIPSAVSEIARVIKKGGWFLLAEDWAVKPQNEREEIASFLQKNRILDKSHCEHHPSQAEWSVMVTACGLEIVSQEHIERPLNLKKMVEEETPEILDKVNRLQDLWKAEAPRTKMLLMLCRKS